MLSGFLETFDMSGCIRLNIKTHDGQSGRAWVPNDSFRVVQRLLGHPVFVIPTSDGEILEPDLLYYPRRMDDLEWLFGHIPGFAHHPDYQRERARLEALQADLETKWSQCREFESI